MAFITGGARDFGWEMAEGLAEAGCNLILTSRSLTDASNAAQKLMARFNPERDPDGVQAFALALDVRDYKAVAVVAAEAIKWKGHVDIVISKWQDCPCAFGTDWLLCAARAGRQGRVAGCLTGKQQTSRN